MSDPQADDLPPLPIAAMLELRRLDPEGETPVTLAPDAAASAALGRLLGVDALDAPRLEGVVRPHGTKGFRLDARLSATAHQRCVVTLDPVVTAIDAPVTRVFAPGAVRDGVIALGPGADEDDEAPEPLGDGIDLAAIMVEELALAIDPYPRAEGAELGEARQAPPGAAPLDPEAEKPFAKLAALRDRLARENE